MRLLTFIHDGAEQIGVRQDDVVVPISAIDPSLPKTMGELVDAGVLQTLKSRMVEADGNASSGIPMAEVEYRPPIPRPGKVLCIGRNYAAHAAEGGAETPSFPEVFARGATSLIPHEARIVRPTCSDKLDFEGEFAFIVGRAGRHISEADALDHVAGYTLFNDATLRDYQRRATQWTVGKNFDNTGAFGPEIVTADELPPGLTGLSLTTHLNGEQVQHGDIDDLVFPVRRLIAILTEAMTLEVGDVIVTGTPSGVGAARTPPLFMKAGDVVEVAVDGLGTLRNTVQDEVSTQSAAG